MIIRCIFLFMLLSGCAAKSQSTSEIEPGAWQMDEYLSQLEGKNVAVTVNHSSLVKGVHLTDTLLRLGVKLTKVFTPEHGFKGTSSDGEVVEYEKGRQNFELLSLHGKNRKPAASQLENIDIMVFDIQDVGARFYTYISTMHYVMEACAESGIPMIILDRPNPNASYVDGPVLDTTFRSFVGMHPIPIVHGLTVGELAGMINGEGWLKNRIQCDITIVKNKNWNHQSFYSLPVKPSPNLPDDLSISLYPGLCLFEQTIMSVGRGTDYAFQQIGHPKYPDSTHSFTPVSWEGAKWPPHQDQLCYGVSWIGQDPSYRFSLQSLIDAYKKMNHDDFFLDYFARLAGTDQLQTQIESGMTEDEIRETWSGDLEQYKLKRFNYLLYD